MRRVVITGMAPICSLGSDHETVFENLCSKKQYKTRIDKNTPARKKIKAEWYVPFPDCYSDDLFQEKLAPVKASGAKSAYIAAKAALLAMQDAKLEQADDNTDRKSTRLNSSHTLASRMPSSA